MNLDPIPAEDIETLKFIKIYAGFCYFGSTAERKVHDFIQRQIAEQLETCELGIIFTRMGRVYVAGGRVIDNLGGIKYALAPELLKVHLLDGKIPTARLLQEFFACIKVCFLILIPLIAYAIKSLLNTPFAEAGYPLRFVLHLLGEQGVGKTTTAMKFALPFDIEEPMKMPFGFVDAGGTPAALRRLFDSMRDVPALLDDIAKTSDPKEDRQRQSTASQLIRYVANAAGRQLVSGKHVEFINA